MDLYVLYEPGSSRQTYTIFQLQDLCLSAVRAASTSLTVLGVVRVELDVLDKIQLGRKVDGTVRLYAANNQVSYALRSKQLG